MPCSRGLLRRQVIRAAKRAGEIYEKGHINNEPTFQMYMVRFLEEEFKNCHTTKNKRFIFCQSIIKPDSKDIAPDIIITNTQTIIAIIELKFTPRQIDWSGVGKDLSNLNEIAQFRDNTILKIERFTGKSKPEYPIAKGDVLFCWIGLHNDTPEVSFKEKLKDQIGKYYFGNCYMEIHLITDEEGRVSSDVFYE